MSFKGKHHTEEVKARLRGANNGMFGKIPWNKGKKYKCPNNTRRGGVNRANCPEVRAKNSKSNIGKQKGDKNPMKRPELRLKDSIRNSGKGNPAFKDGLCRQRRRHKSRRGLGFIPISNKQPYSESIEWHHLDPNLPYVVPCPARIHRMFIADPNHFSNVNAMLGIISIGGAAK